MINPNHDVLLCVAPSARKLSSFSDFISFIKKKKKKKKIIVISPHFLLFDTDILMGLSNKEHYNLSVSKYSIANRCDNI